MTLIIIGLIVLLALIGTPLYAVIGLAALISFHTAEIDPAAIFIELYRIAASPTLIAIPLFTFAGFILANGKTPKKLARLSRALLGGIPGGVPLVVLIACAFFTAFTGASGVTIIALGGLLYPLMLKEAYSKDFSLGLMTSSGSLGLLFPPSLPLILYALIAQVSVDRLFLAGIIPGLVMVFILALYSISKSRTLKISSHPFNKKEALSAVRETAWEIPLPFIILVGIYSGVFTITEAATVTVVYVTIIAVWVNNDLHLLNDIPRLMQESMVLVGTILIILGTAMGFTNYLIDEQVPMQILAFMKQHIDDKMTFLILLNIFLLAVGCMMDIFSAIVVVVPLISEIGAAYDIDPVHLGIIFVANLELGYLTPPVGLNLFLASYRFGRPLLQVYRASIPLLVILGIGVLIITYVPWLTQGLLELVGRR